MISNNIFFWIVGTIEIVYLMFYFGLYNNLKRKEEGLIDGDKLSKIKKYFLKNTTKEMATLVKAILAIVIVSIISLLFIESKFSSMARTIILFMTFFFVTITIISLVAYTKVYRKREPICNAKNIGRILHILNIKKTWNKKIKNMIDVAWNSRDDDNFLLAWFLDSLEFDDNRIKNKKN